LEVIIILWTVEEGVKWIGDQDKCKVEIKIF
jgi:hypothetical protein